MSKLSVIIPFANEHPQVLFTVQSIFCELRDSGIDFEIIVIDNWCAEVAAQNRFRDAGSEKLQSLADGDHRPWLRYIHFDKKLSHWNAKNAGVQASTGDFLWFCDAHCVVSKDALTRMFKYYEQHCEELNGTLHMPISYLLERDGQELIYKFVYQPDHAVYHYSFTPYRKNVPADRPDVPFRMPCMSTCGMMMTRKLYDLLGGWPSELGIYGGGEHFINFCLAVLGKTVNIMPGYSLFHYAAERGYNWNYDDYHRNRGIATFMFGGEELCQKYMMHVKGRPLVLERMYYDIVTKARDHRDLIAANQAMEIEEWVKQWLPK